MFNSQSLSNFNSKSENNFKGNKSSRNSGVKSHYAQDSYLPQINRNASDVFMNRLPSVIYSGTLYTCKLK